MRLIDADKFLDFIKSELKQDRTDEKHLENIICVLENLPTAFDVDKVEKELEKRRKEYKNEAYKINVPFEYSCYLKGIMRGYEYSIDVVKAGGIDE